MRGGDFFLALILGKFKDWKTWPEWVHGMESNER